MKPKTAVAITAAASPISKSRVIFSRDQMLGSSWFYITRHAAPGNRKALYSIQSGLGGAGRWMKCIVDSLGLFEINFVRAVRSRGDKLLYLAWRE
jgi:hypothetical protein